MTAPNCNAQPASDTLGMLVLTMCSNERVTLRERDGTLIASISLQRPKAGKVRIAVSAPKHIVIGREDTATPLAAKEIHARTSYGGGA